MKKLQSNYDEEIENYESGSDLGSNDEENEEEVHTETAMGAKKRVKLSNNKANKKLKSSKYTKQPTTEELNRLRETENLFNSNFFRLQIDEILKEVTVKPKYVNQFNKWLIDFNQFLQSLEDDSVTYDVSDKTWLKKSGIKFPIGEEPSSTKGHFKFIKCSPAQVIGSQSFGACMGPDLSVDLVINLSKEFINKNDYLNERYHRKRGLYLCFIAKQLKNTNLVQDMKFKFIDDCHLKPVLILQPSVKSGKHIKITLHVGFEECAIKLIRFLPYKSNVRENWRYGKKDSEADSSINVPTPHYNSTILSDMTIDINHKFLMKHIENNANLQQGILLLKIWLAQRNMSQFSGYIVSMFVAYLVKIKRINNAMSSYQIVRNAWTVLGSSEWDKKGITLLDESQASSRHPSIQEFHNYFDVVFVDCSGFYNICAFLSLDVYNAVRHESKLAVTYLDSQYFNGFSALFMVPVKFELKYDHIIRIENTPKLFNILKQHLPNNEVIDYGFDSHFVIETYLLNILRRGLNNRVTMIMPKCRSSGDVTWQCDKVGSLNIPYIFGLKLNPEHAFRSVDKGPQANLPEAEEFREFWGAKSELRRFQDGSISEACVWQTAPTAESRRSIVKQIVYYLLETKLGIKDVFYISDQFDPMLHSNKFLPANFEYGTGEEATSRISASFDGLMKNLRSLTDTPLDIHSIHGISAVFSYTDLCPPLPYAPASSSGFTSCEKYRLIRDEVKEVKKKSSERTELAAPLFIPSLRVVIQLSQSGKWPDDLEAFKRIKTAFYIQIAEALEDQFQMTSHPFPNHVDVIKDGYVFRIEIAHSKEISLMKKVFDKDGVSRFQDTEESLELEYRLMHLPRLRIALNGLHLQNPSYGPATCLLKRWLRSHFIDDAHFPDICIDIMMAYLFLQPAPYEVANQPLACFLRALAALATTDWTNQMIVLNFNNDITKERLTEIESNFNLNRSSLPAMYILTPYEGKKPSVWSRHAPTFQILARIQMLAEEALKFVDLLIFKQLSNDAQALFTPNLDGYHVLIYLQPALNPLQYLQSNIKNESKKKTKPYEKLNKEMFPVLDFDPVQIYLKQLRASYSEFALFFHNTYGGDVIGVLWKPSVLEFKEFKVSLLNGRKAVMKNGINSLISDIDAILDGFMILGDGFVKNIEVKNNITV